MGIFRSKRGRGLAGIAVGATIALALTACQGASEPAAPGDNGNEVESVTLTAVTAWDESNESHYAPFQAFLDAIEAEDAGITVNVIGGPETMPPSEVAENLANGSMDIALNTGSYFSNTVPEALLLSLSNLDPDEWRSQGLLDELNGYIIEKLNQRALGRLGWGLEYAFYSKDPIASVDDFNGLRFRGSPVYAGIMAQLGVEMVDMPPSDVYTAIERGTVSGTAWPYPGITDLALEEVVEYVVHPTFYTNGISLYINEETWQGLSEAHQEALERAAIAAEKFTPQFAVDLRDRERQLIEERGINIVEFEGDMADEFLARATAGGVDVLVSSGIDRVTAEELIERFNN